MTFVSYAQNYEDVILWRALKHVERGFYVDIGAHDPVAGSVSLAFYERGWRGVHAEPVPASAAKLAQARPDEKVYAAAIGDGDARIDFFVAANAGLSTGDADVARRAGATTKIRVDCLPLARVLDEQQGRAIHWLKIDAEGMEARVIASWLPSKARPWIVVVESTVPNSRQLNFSAWDPQLRALGYDFVYFDGLNRFYASKEHPELAQAFGPGPNVFDDFVQARTLRLENALALRDQQAARSKRAPQKPQPRQRKELSPWQKVLQTAGRDIGGLVRAAKTLLERAKAAALPATPRQGRGGAAIVVIGPAWSTGGSYQAMRRQVEICNELGFATFFLAIGHLSVHTARRKSYWDAYLKATPDLPAAARAHAARSRPLVLHRRFWTDYPAALWRSTAYAATMHIGILDLPDELARFAATHDIKAIICNHYFNLPMARKLRRLAPAARVILETQDVQSHHLRDRVVPHPVTKRPSRLDAMLKDEIRISRQASVMVHYNEDEAALFQRLAPDRPHHVVFPTVPRNHAPAAAGTGAPFDFLMVASAHDANLNGLIWFFDEVWDSALETSRTLKIAGNIDQLLARKSPWHHRALQQHFLGQVDDLSPLYRQARVVLLPVTGGHGIAVKTIEALSWGKAIIATPLAFRGFERHLPPEIRAEIVDGAAGFRQRMLAVPSKGKPKPDARSVALYENLFSPEMQLAAYRRLLLPKSRT